MLLCDVLSKIVRLYIIYVKMWGLQLICYHILVCFLIDLFTQWMNFLILKVYNFVLLRSVNSVLFWRMKSCLRLTLCHGILRIHLFESITNRTSNIKVVCSLILTPVTTPRQKNRFEHVCTEEFDVQKGCSVNY
jgi:hypothetical protein